MKKLSAPVAAMLVCAAPALAQAYEPDDACGGPQTTGSLPVELHKPTFMGALSGRVETTPPEESWQEQAKEDAERRRREEVEGCSVE